MGILNTFRGGFEAMRSADVTEADTIIDGSTSGYTWCFSDKPSHARQLGIEYNGAQIFFTGGKSYGEGISEWDVTQDGRATAKIIGYPSNGPGFEICDVSILVGENRAYPTVEGIDASESVACCSLVLDSTVKHPTNITISNADDTQGIANLTMDTVGMEWIAVQYSSVCFPVNAHIRPY